MEYNEQDYGHYWNIISYLLFVFYSGPPSRESFSPLIPGVMDISRPSSDLQGMYNVYI